MSKREETIELAVRFLKDPKVQQSTLAKRIAFLESKGLTAEEIEEAVNRANAAAGSTSTPSPAAGTTTPATTATANSAMPNNSAVQPYQQPMQQQGPPLPPGGPSQMMMYQPYPQQQYGQAPMYGNPAYGPMVPQPPQNPLTWKDYTLGAIGVAAVGYGLFEFGKRYVAPYFMWPTEAKLAADQKRMEEQISTATAAVKEARESTELLMKDVKNQSTNIGSALDQLKEIVKDIQETDEKRDQEIKGIKEDIDGIRDMIPKMLDKAKDAQNNALVDLQNELKSLKNLLLNRRVGPAPIGTPAPAPSVPGVPGVPGVPDTTAPAAPLADNSAYTTSPGGQGTPGLGGVGSIKPYSFGKPVGIPAWQLSAGGGSSSASGSVNGTSSEGDKPQEDAPAS
ncbi:peroxisomal membrane protein pex14 [Phlyctochytrium bullatum]|nr:peroxisomal membrane protein pex14 [Phlyctochytrium bullatum]